MFFAGPSLTSACFCLAHFLNSLSGAGLGLVPRNCVALCACSVLTLWPKAGYCLPAFLELCSAFFARPFYRDRGLSNKIRQNATKTRRPAMNERYRATPANCLHRPKLEINLKCLEGPPVQGTRNPPTTYSASMSANLFFWIGLRRASRLC